MTTTLKLTYCKKCLMPTTRPRMQLDENGVCNACNWAEEKKKFDWSKRWDELESLCDKYRNRNKNNFDVIVPYSGGKDGAYIASMLKNKLGMTPLVVTIRPPMENPIGEQNIKNFLDCGFDHVMITPNRKISSYIDKQEFINKGIPMHAHMMAVQTALFKCAVQYDIPFVMFAEEGESEYGGSTKLKNQHTYDIEESINFYLSGTNPKQYLDKFSEKELYWYTYPSKEELIKLQPEISHWSYFQNFDGNVHRKYAIDHCGLQTREGRSIGSYEGAAATDTDIIFLYHYMMYIKFGFGRAASLASCDIRAGEFAREEALALSKKYDGEYPKLYIPKYLEYFNITQNEFDGIIDKWVNKELFEKIDGRWTPLFEQY